MTPEMAARFDAWIEENTRGTGLTLNWWKYSAMRKVLWNNQLA
jgi:hypothetical protein